jgi:hypothetical protein
MEIQDEIVLEESKVVCKTPDCGNFDKVAIVVFPKIGLKFVEEKDASNPLSALRGY